MKEFWEEFLKGTPKKILKVESLWEKSLKTPREVSWEKPIKEFMKQARETHL